MDILKNLAMLTQLLNCITTFLIRGMSRNWGSKNKEKVLNRSGKGMERPKDSKDKERFPFKTEVNAIDEKSSDGNGIMNREIGPGKPKGCKEQNELAQSVVMNCSFPANRLVARRHSRVMPAGYTQTAAWHLMCSILY